MGDEKTYRMIVNNDLQALKAALESGEADAKHVQYGLTWLHTAAEHGFGEGIALLIEHGADPNAKSDREDTALIIAVIHKQPDAIPPLLAGGADPETPNKIGATPAQYAVQMNAGGTGVEVTVTVDGVEKKVDQQPRYVAAQECLKHLLSGGANADAEDGRGMTGLHIAASKGDLEFATILLEGGAKVDHANGNGYQAIHSAAGAGQLEMVELLLAKGADPSASDNSGFTPLHDAAAAGNEALVKLLLDKGASKDATIREGWKDLKEGMTPKEVAQVKGHESIAALL